MAIDSRFFFDAFCEYSRYFIVNSGRADFSFLANHNAAAEYHYPTDIDKSDKKIFFIFKINEEIKNVCVMFFLV